LEVLAVLYLVTLLTGLLWILVATALQDLGLWPLSSATQPSR
jgi:hypothetical protein